MHPREHEERLAALLAGELDSDASRRPAWLAECATCRERWEALQGVAVRIGGAGATQRERLDELGRLPREPVESAFATELLRLAAREPHVVRRPRRALLVAAAAALLCLGAWLGSRWGEREPAPVWLDTKKLVLVRPVDAADSFEVFEWTLEEEAESFTLNFYYYVDGVRTQLTVDKWHEKTWKPSAEDRALFGRSIEWDVTAYDQGGIIDSAAAKASLSSSR